jgi:hypothetical protein
MVVSVISKRAPLFAEADRALQIIKTAVEPHARLLPVNISLIVISSLRLPLAR